jgi:hypothetical protein
MFAALQLLTKEREPHPCGGFTTDDMQWQMGSFYESKDDLLQALEELLNARLIRHAGYDDDDAIGTCYGLRTNNQASDAQRSD